MPASHSRFRLPWRTTVVGGLTLGLLWWFFRTLDVSRVWDAITHAHMGLILAAALVTFQTYILRTWRWQALLLPVGRARFGPAFRSTLIGFTATFLLPGRVGEVLRPYLLAREEGFSAAATFATILVERALDLATVVLLFAGFLLTTAQDVGTDVKLGGALAAAIAVGGLIVMALSAGHPERLGRWAGRATRLLPSRLAAAATGLVQTFVQGLGVMRRPRVLLWSLVLSVLLWLSIALGIWCTSLAFDLTLPFAGTFLVMLFLTLGVAVPTPSGLGTFHWAYRFAMTTFFAAPAPVAAAAAIVLHAVSFVPVSLTGLALMAREGLSLLSLQRMKPVAEIAEGS